MKEIPALITYYLSKLVKPTTNHVECNNIFYLTVRKLGDGVPVGVYQQFSKSQKTVILYKLDKLLIGKRLITPGSGRLALRYADKFATSLFVTNKAQRINLAQK